MIINKEIKAKIEVIARKMSKLGFGDIKALEKEIYERYVQIELAKVAQF